MYLTFVGRGVWWGVTHHPGCIVRMHGGLCNLPVQLCPLLRVVADGLGADRALGLVRGMPATAGFQILYTKWACQEKSTGNVLESLDRICQTGCSTTTQDAV